MTSAYGIGGASSGHNGGTGGIGGSSGGTGAGGGGGGPPPLWSDGTRGHGSRETLSASLTSALLAGAVLLANCSENTQVLPSAGDTTGTDTGPAKDSSHPGDLPTDSTTPSPEPSPGPGVATDAAPDVALEVASEISPEDSPDAELPSPDSDVATNDTADTPALEPEPASEPEPELPTVDFCTHYEGNTCLTDDPLLVPAEVTDQTATLLAVGEQITLKAGTPGGLTQLLNAAAFLIADNAPIDLTVVGANGTYPAVLSPEFATTYRFALPPDHTCLTSDPNDPAYYDENNTCAAFYRPEWHAVGTTALTLTTEEIAGTNVVWLQGIAAFLLDESTATQGSCTGRYFTPCLEALNPVVTP